jgi:hypothetical protein
MNASGEHVFTAAHADAALRGLPIPTPQFRHRAWREFQRALDPLAPPKPLRRPKQLPVH